MATYCKNHVEEEVKKLKPITKGKIERIPTKEGMCGHLGGCNTAHDNLYQLKYDYRPPKESKKDAKKSEGMDLDNSGSGNETETFSATGDKPEEPVTS